MKKQVGIAAGVVLGLISLSTGAFLYPTGNVIQGMYLGDRNVSQANKDELADIVEADTYEGKMAGWQSDYHSIKRYRC